MSVPYAHDRHRRSIDERAPRRKCRPPIVLMHQIYRSASALRAGSSLEPRPKRPTRREFAGKIARSRQFQEGVKGWGQQRLSGEPRVTAWQRNVVCFVERFPRDRQASTHAIACVHRAEAKPVCATCTITSFYGNDAMEMMQTSHFPAVISLARLSPLAPGEMEENR